MSNISAQSKSFIVLFIIAIFGTFLAINLSLDLLGSTGYKDQEYSSKKVSNPNTAAKNTPAEPVIDTSNWKTYTNKNYNLTFKYDPSWKILPIVEKNGWNILQVDPGKKFYNFKIYISPKDFYIMKGLPLKSDTIGGAAATNCNDLLYGVQNNGLYYTFDIGLSTSLRPNFSAFVHSVNFGG